MPERASAPAGAAALALTCAWLEVDRSQQEAVVAILARRLEAAAAQHVEAVVQAAEGVVHLRLEHRLMAEDCYTKL